ncbi:RHS repeat-associated core domain-containing protein [Streptomyces sp. B22F1]|uniref:RHS repeat-associated core domain-containing protein n=1 Tax=Streptomyces sp. B22F1 TaxID=3153566 RepID=UPI00325DAF52
MGNRPTDWHVLDLDDDPTPGDPERVKQLARELHDFADDVADALRQIKGMAGEDALLRWAGKTAKAFQDEFDEVPKNLKKLQRSYDLAGDALAAYWPKLERAQSLADKALAKGREAQSDLTAASGRLDAANSWVERATKKTEEYDGKEGREKPDESEVRAATRNATDAKSARASAQTAVDNAQGGLEAAKKMAADAKKMREDAASEAKDKLEEASDAGIQNRKWWEKAVDWVKDNWDTIVNVCKVIVAVLGIVVLIIGGPLAWVVLAAALVVLADTLYKYMNGQASLWDVAFAALDCIPGMKGLTTLGGLAKMAKGGMKAMAGLRAMKAGVLGLAKRGGDMLAGAAKGAHNRLKNIVSKLTDPVDLASGTMYLSLTDIELPGLLPLDFTRRLGSTYRCGWWFGPTWASTADQHVEVDERGVVFATEDGRVLAYPHPAGPGTQSLPESGPRWPLTQLEGGGYVVTDPITGHSRTFACPDAEGLALIEKISDRNGHTITFAYDDEGTPTDIRHSGGYHLKLTTDSDLGRITAISLADAADDGSDVVVKRFGYDGDGNLTEDIDSSGNALAFTYDERLRVTSWTDRIGHRYDYVYDAQDRCIAEGGEAGHLAVTIDYDGIDPDWPGATVTTLTTAEGHATRFIVNDNSQIIAEADPLGHLTRTEYDEHHNLIAESDPLGHTTTYAYSAAGRTERVTWPDGATARFTHGELELLTRAELPGGIEWRWEYDERGNCLASIDPTGEITRYAYDGNGLLTSVHEPDGATTAVRCTPTGLPAELTDPLGGTTRYRYDGFGRINSQTDPLGATTRARWSVEGKLLLWSTPDGAENSWAYDGEGNCVLHTDAAGATRRYAYTHFDLLATRTDPDGGVHTYEYDTQRRVTSVANPLGQTWRYVYDPSGRLVEETDFDGRRTAYTYDATGALVRRENALGETVEFEYDALRQLTAKRSGGAVSTFEYGPSGELLRATGPESRVEWERDGLDRILSETTDGRTTTFTYDAVGRPIRRATPAGQETHYRYDPAGNLASLTTAAGPALAVTRDALGQVLSRRLGGLTLQQSRDPVGRLSGQQFHAGSRSIGARSYHYGPAGALTAVDDPARGRTAFQLDDSERVTAVDGPYWQETYAYDALGNQIAATWPEQHGDATATGARTYAPNLVTAGGTRYEYDRAGRVTARIRKRLSRKPDVWRYEWDAEDRLTAVTTPDGTRWRYLYDPLGRRTAKLRMAADGTTVVAETRFTWHETTLIEQTSLGPELPHPVTLTWEYEGGTPIAQAERLTGPAPQEVIDSRFFAIVTDMVGTPTELVDEHGTVAWHSRSTLWGRTAWAADSTAHTPLRFPGQYDDPESGLHYNVLRYYDPDIARYLSPDPLGLAPAPNPAAYVDNPHVWTDPLGLAPYGKPVRMTLNKLQLKGPEYKLTDVEKDFVKQLLERRGNLQVYRTDQKAGMGDFAIVDMSDATKKVGWIVDHKMGGGALPGHQLRNAAQAAADLGLVKFDLAAGDTPKLLEILSKPRRAW